MRTEEIKLYEFKELDESAKQYAISKFREKDNYPHSDWAECLLDTIQGELKEKGYPDVKIAYSGFWSQGDGASFTCENVDIEKWLELRPENRNYQRILKLIKNGFIDINDSKIVRDKWHNYVHENTITFYVDFRINGKLGTDALQVSDVLEQIESDIDVEKTELSKDIYNRLSKEYDNITTDEAIVEEMKSRELEFYDTGRVYE